MKIKKIALIRPEIEVETSKPLLGWCYIIFNYFRFVKFFKMKVRFVIWSKLLKDAGHIYTKPMWFVSIPKFQVILERNSND